MPRHTHAFAQSLAPCRGDSRTALVVVPSLVFDEKQDIPGINKGGESGCGYD